ncbi:MAG: choice-of-anchor U domain-containing protein [bacterium]
MKYNSIKKCILIICLIIGPITFLHLTHAAINYEIINLGTLDGQGTSTAQINNQGQVAGEYVTTSGFWNVFFRTEEGDIIILGTLGGETSHFAGMNDQGQVMGYSAIEPLSTQYHAFLWTPEGEGNMQDLGTLSEGTMSFPHALNNQGHVVGWSDTGEAMHAFLWRSGEGMRDLGTLGGSRSVAWAINDLGQVVGESEIATEGQLHAFLWTEEGGMIDLHPIGGWASAAYGINNQGQVVGQVQITEDEWHVFSWKEGETTDLGTLEGANSSFILPPPINSINEAGNIMGLLANIEFDIFFGYVHTFLWTYAEGIMEDIESSHELPILGHWISDHDYIVGEYFTSSLVEPHGFLWTADEGLYDLGIPEGLLYSTAYAVNNRNQILGAGMDENGAMHLLIWEPDSDGDGVYDYREQGPEGESGYDGNDDGEPDSQQAHVTSLPTYDNAYYVTLATSDKNITMEEVKATDNPSPFDIPPEVVNFPYGFFEFTVQDISPGGATIVTLYLHEGESPNAYYKYGPTQDNPEPHWYVFMYDDSGTGAEIGEDSITLYFIDGMRGDDDLVADGTIIDQGAPGISMSSPTIVSIDIKPDNDHNCINNNGRGVIPVTIFGEFNFNVRAIDPSSLLLEDLLTLKTQCKDNKLMYHYEYVNDDEFEDLVVQFKDVQGVFSEDATTATLTGSLYNGTLFEGTDSVCIILAKVTKCGFFCKIKRYIRKYIKKPRKDYNQFKNHKFSAP